MKQHNKQPNYIINLKFIIIMKKIFTLFAALAMVMSMSAAKLYLTPNSNWNQSNARFAAYFFGNGEKWISMTKVAGETNLYEVEAPAGYPKVIFCRMNPSSSANNWDEGVKWNQTGDLTIPTDGKNHYTVKDGTWDKGGGEWTIWPVPAEKNYVDVTITVTANAAASIKWHSAGDKLANATDYVAMNAGENNTYTYTLAQVDDFSGVKYTIKVGDVVSEEQTTSTNVTADFKTLMKQAFLKGSMNDWGDKGKMTIADDYLTASIVLSLNAGSYEWKMYVGVDWLGGGKTVTRENNTHKLTDGDNCNLTADIKGNYTFTWTYATNTLTVTYPAVKYNVKVTAENGTVTGAGEYEEGAEATLIAAPAEGYEFVNWTKGEEIVSTENPYTFTVTADVALVANFVAVDYKDITFTVGKSGFTGVPQIKWWGAKGLEDAAEPVEMTAGQYNRYSYTFSNIDAITGVSFYIVLDGVQSKTITLHETPNTYSQFYTILQEVFVTLDGETEGVQLEGHPMAGYSSDYTKVNGVVQLPANTTKAFKLTVDGKDKGGNTIALTKDNLTANFTEDGEGNATIATELAGGYLFTYDYITKDVTVVYPFVGTMDLGQMTPSYSDESVTLKDDNYNEVTIYNVVEGEHTYGENFDIEASVKHNGEWYTLTGKGSWTLADGVMTLVTTNLVDENKTVNYTITATALAPQEYTIVCNGTYDEEVTEYYSSIKYAATTDEEDVIVIEIGVYGEETSASGQFNDTWFTTLTYTVEEGEDGVKVLTATATDEAGNTYHITITATKLVYPSINIYNATLVEEKDGDVSLACTYEDVNLTLNYSYAMWAGGYTAELASGDYSVYYSCEAPSLEKDGSNYTITGVFSDENSNKYNVMVTTKANPATSLDNLNSTVAPVKMIENGQLIIVKDGVQYNAQGAVVK